MLNFIGILIADFLQECRYMRSQDQWLWKWLSISLLLHLAAAVFSVGFQNSDEHFQILEFLNYWIGRSPSGDLPIEFHREMRPWLQIFLYWIPVRSLRAFGIDNPFAWATSIRLLSALIGWSSVVILAKNAKNWIQDEAAYRLAIFSLTLTWFIPALHARHSSENISGALMALAICLANTPGQLFFAGLLTGLAFECRYQVGVMGFGLFLWLILICRARIKQISLFLIGCALAIGLGTIADRIGYGNWVFPPWNYFKFNLLEGNLDAAGVYPFWDYFRRAWTESVPFLGLITLTTLILSWFLAPKSSLTWTMAPFFLFHAGMGHKETRFLFPMMHVAPLALANVIRLDKIKSNRLFFSLVRVIVGFNLLTLIALTFLPTLFTIRFFSVIYELTTQSNPPTLTLNLKEQDPYLFGGVPLNFYRPEGLILKQSINTFNEARNTDSLIYEGWWATTRANALPQCKLYFSTYPIEIENFIGNKSFNRFRNWSLFWCPKN